MRLAWIVLTALLAVGVPAGCGAAGTDAGERIAAEVEGGLEQSIDESAGFTVFFDADATDRQQSDVRAWLERQPGITEIVFEDKATAYAKARELWAESNPEFFESVRPDALPEAFRMKLRDGAAGREIRDGAAGDELEAMPGVREVVFPCTSLPECQDILSSQSPRPPR